MIHAQEKGRRLHLTVGEGDDTEVFIIPPVDVQTGAGLLATFLGIYSGILAPDEEIQGAEDLVITSVGEENYERAQTLRSEEFRSLTQAAFFWNTQGGGLEAVNALLQDGHPKAVEVVFEAAGVLNKQPSPTSPSSESETPTP